MKKYNCIIVFNAEKTETLFCKRMKDPYKGLYNFVGGKVESTENGIDAAYRELYEETGILSHNIRLHRLMDIRYYYQNFILELYVGRLSSKIELTDEANPLVWLPLTKNFADPDRFAGEQNIAHIINIAMKYPLEKANENNSSVLDVTSLSIGVDGCKGGWVVAIIKNGDLCIEKYPTMKRIVSKYEKFDEFLIDMVIGLPSSNSYLRPDSEARKMIPGRTSTIFAVPCRQAVYADSEEEQVVANNAALGKGLAKQTMAIIPKMRELDEFFTRETQYKNVIKESHPEVCFAKLNGNVVMSKKTRRVGMTERIHILQKYLPGLTERYVMEKKSELKCNADDIVDAICLAVTANLSTQGKGMIIPEKPMKDDHGLLMRMVIPLTI